MKCHLKRRDNLRGEKSYYEFTAGAIQAKLRKIPTLQYGFHEKIFGKFSQYT